MKKLILFSVVLSGLVVAFTILAVSKDDIVFPVGKLGNCQNEEECRLYCDDPANQQFCFDFAKSQGLISEEELQKFEQFAPKPEDFAPHKDFAPPEGFPGGEFMPPEGIPAS